QTSTQATGIAVDPNHSLVAYLTLSGFRAITTIGHIYKTSDYGTTWAEDDGLNGANPLPDVPVLRLLVDRNDASGNTLYAATDVGVFRSADGGANWSAFNLNTIPPVPVFDIEQQSSGTGTIFAGTHGRGAFRLSFPSATPTA